MDTAAVIADLNRRFGIPGVARIVAGNGGLAKVQVETPRVAGEMYLHGAHVTSWRPQGAQEVLFVSSLSHWEDGRPIRGGVPVCFPWFANRAGDPKAPAHGFVRTKGWRIEGIESQGDAVTVRIVTESNDETKKWWPASFRLSHRVSFGHQLVLELEVVNTGTSECKFEEALHTYFSVPEIAPVRVHGLDQVAYLDKTDQNRRKVQDGPIQIVSETDRVYLDTAGEVELVDSSRRIRVAKEASLTTVVWNPWVAKAQAMADFGDAEWQRMICIETCNVADFAVTLAAGQRHTMKAHIRVA